MKNRIKGVVFLLITALLWGSSFVAQKSGMDTMGPITFMCLRSFVGAIVLFPVALIYGKATEWTEEVVKTKRISGWKLILAGLICGCAYLAASLLQQFGLWFGTSAGKSAFITALYIVMTPILGIFIGKKMPIKNWICVAIAVVGMFKLCVHGGFSFALGDLLTFFCAICFGIHILLIDKFASNCNCVMLSCLQFLFSGIISFVPMMLIEKPTFAVIEATLFPILYMGICSNGIAYTLQIFGQKYLEPSPASLLMSLESVFAAIAGWLFLNENMSSGEIIGCVLIGVSIVLAQVTFSKNAKKDKKSVEKP